MVPGVDFPLMIYGYKTDPSEEKVVKQQFNTNNPVSRPDTQSHALVTCCFFDKS